MKWILQILLVMVLAFTMELFLPWWSVAVAAALSAVMLGGNAYRSTLAGLLGVFLLWYFGALAIQAESGSDLAARVGLLLPGKPGAGGVAFITGCVGGLVGAFSAACGEALRRLIQPDRP